jgi:Transglutaminase-like enzymes, putative cysteine proteases
MWKRVQWRRAVTALCLVVCLLFSAVAIAIIWPSADGEKTGKDGALTVDMSHASDGYIMVRGKESKKAYKVRVTCGDKSLNYDLDTDGSYIVLPLQFGSGKYKVELFRNVQGKKYTQEGAVTVKAELSSATAPFLVPNQYVSYTPDSAAVALSNEICEGLTTPREKYDAICDYVKQHFVYDYVKAVTVAPSTLPDVDLVVETKMGICQDLAACVACMLRVQGIPTMLVIGYANKNYHAWNNVIIDGETIVYDPTAVLTNSGKVTYTVERYY